MKKYPVGIQDFRKIRQEGYLYIDKSKYLYEVASVGQGYFLSRPRRFGKSLFLSALEALFLGERELFKGLSIDQSDYDWASHPVIRLDFSRTISDTTEALNHSLQELLLVCASQYGINHIQREHPAMTLSALVIELAKKNSVVILIDEYDKPLVHHFDNGVLLEQNRLLLNDFFTHIKSLSEYLRHVFVTGVSKFSQVSLFSGLNNLKDISFYDSFAHITGITEEEIYSHLQPELTLIAAKKEFSCSELVDKLRFWYNGYRFSPSTETATVYNPLSLISFLESNRFGNYWFATATPTFAIKLIKKRNFALPDLEQGVITGKEIELSYEFERIDLPTLLFQTGYLTIRSFDESTQTYFLTFPNEEVRQSFLNHLFADFTSLPASEAHSFVYNLRKALAEEDLELGVYP